MKFLFVVASLFLSAHAYASDFSKIQGKWMRQNPDGLKNSIPHHFVEYSRLFIDIRQDRTASFIVALGAIDDGGSDGEIKTYNNRMSFYEVKNRDEVLFLRRHNQNLIGCSWSRSDDLPAESDTKGWNEFEKLINKFIDWDSPSDLQANQCLVYTAVPKIPKMIQVGDQVPFPDKLTVTLNIKVGSKLKSVPIPKEDMERFFTGLHPISIEFGDECDAYWPRCRTLILKSLLVDATRPQEISSYVGIVELWSNRMDGRGMIDRIHLASPEFLKEGRLLEWEGYHAGDGGEDEFKGKLHKVWIEIQK